MPMRDINAIIAELDKVTDILTTEIPTTPPDMDVLEWAQTPVGRAVAGIEDAIAMMLEEDDDDNDVLRAEVKSHG